MEKEFVYSNKMVFKFVSWTIYITPPISLLVQVKLGKFEQYML